MSSIDHPPVRSALSSRVTLADLFGPPEPFVFQLDPSLDAATNPWIIYVVRQRGTDRCYVGLSSRSFEARIAAHLTVANRVQPVRPDGLLQALRSMQRAGRRFADDFDARVVARTASADEAAEAECRWIDMLQCRAPRGYNLMPGGGVGSVANAQPIAIQVEANVQEGFGSIHQAIAARNRNQVQLGQPIIEPSTVYARLAAGWSPEEALEFRPHQDGRGRREPFQVQGRTFSSLSEASAQTGIGIETLRSRLHRLTDETVMGGVRDIGTDRRSARRGGSLLRIIWPGTREVMTAEAVASRTGMAKSTVLHRWHRVRKANCGSHLSPAALIKLLVARTDRRNHLELRLPDGRILTGGEREIVRQVLGNPALEPSRSTRLSEGGVRRRLRLLSAKDRRNPDRLRWAFGFEASADGCGHTIVSSAAGEG